MGSNGGGIDSEQRGALFLELEAARMYRGRLIGGKDEDCLRNG